MADPVFGLIRWVEKLSTERELAEGKLLLWFKSLGGEQALLEVLRTMQMDMLISVGDAMGAQIQGTARNKEVAYRSYVVGWFQHLQSTTSTGPCHWCNKPATSACSGCNNNKYIHNECLKQRVPAFPGHLDDRYCRGCAKRKLDAVADAKTMCGDGVILLGAQLDTVAERVRCPLIKRRWLLHAAQLIRDGLVTDMRVDTTLMARFTGRLTNLSQFFPELRIPLSVGYAISRVTWVSKDGFRRRPLRYVQLRRGGRREEELLTLLAVAADVAEDDWGVPLAPVRRLSPASASPPC